MCVFLLYICYFCKMCCQLFTKKLKPLSHKALRREQHNLVICQHTVHKLFFVGRGTANM